ncbi:hypothetical protein B0H14DRAFT_626565 [Mycena olivaceomarginata]|nr:hypothetical protein B0H14DRAFT_626565 [Mycena olivaceomarginata]
MLKTLKSWAKRYSDTEAAVHDATSTDPWGPSGTEMDKIAQLTYNQEDIVEIRDMLVTRLNNNEGKNWRQVYKSLVVIDYILHHGPEYANVYFKFKFYSISVLEKFQYFDEYGHDQGQKVRDKAANIANLLLDEGRLHSERRTWASMRERILVGRGEGVERQIERSNQEDRLGYIESSEATLLHPLLTPRTGPIQVDGSEDRPRQPPYTTHGADGLPLSSIDFIIQNYLSRSSEAPENDASSLCAIESGKPSLLPEQQLRADLAQSNSSEDSIGSARQLPYYAAADGTPNVQLRNAFTRRIQTPKRRWEMSRVF